MDLMASFGAFLSEMLGVNYKTKTLSFLCLISWHASDSCVIGFGFWVLGPRSLVFCLRFVDIIWG